MSMIDKNMERASVPMVDFTVAVISDNTGIVTITPIKHCDTVFHAILVFRQIKKNAVWLEWL